MEDRSKIITVVLLVVVTAAIPITVLMTQNFQSIQQKAQTPQIDCSYCAKRNSFYLCYDQNTKISYCGNSSHSGDALCAPCNGQ